MEGEIADSHGKRVGDGKERRRTDANIKESWSLRGDISSKFANHG